MKKTVSDPFPSIAHKGNPHAAGWRVKKSKSVFGLVHIHAILTCGVCGVETPPRVYLQSDFKITGTHRLSYWLK